MTIEELGRWKRGELRADAVVAVARHVAECRACATLAASQVDLGKATQSIRRQIGARENTRFRLLAIAASLAIFMIVGAFLLLGRAPQQTPTAVLPPTVTATQSAPALPPAPSYGREDWDRLVADARSGVTFAAPAILPTIRPLADVLRGDGPEPVEARLEPTGVVIESQRPRFSWPSTQGAIYNVAVFSDGKAAARGRSLRTQAWTPTNAIPRGKTYTWEVEVIREGEEPLILPSPPVQSARFHIVSESEARDLAYAREHFPDDHLLLGLLYAKLGMDTEAAAELQKVKDGRDDDAAKRLLTEIATWQR
ncbi:MAG: hypothetical protein M3P06_21005 [Acidobacteriota bacterium]|nr:hypothetical protein [Acidobacteriota bacterium]